jgi:hypothetical protein
VLGGQTGGQLLGAALLLAPGGILLGHVAFIGLLAGYGVIAIYFLILAIVIQGLG